MPYFFKMTYSAILGMFTLCKPTELVGTYVQVNKKRIELVIFELVYLRILLSSSSLVSLSYTVISVTHVVQNKDCCSVETWFMYTTFVLDPEARSLPCMYDPCPKPIGSIFLKRVAYQQCNNNPQKTRTPILT